MMKERGLYMGCFHWQKNPVASMRQTSFVFRGIVRSEHGHQ